MKIKSNTLTINCFSEEYTIEEKACFFFGITEFTTGAEDTFCMMRNFLKEYWREYWISEVIQSAKRRRERQGQPSFVSWDFQNVSLVLEEHVSRRATLIKSSQVKSIDLYLTKVAPSVTGWYQKRPCVKLRLHDNLKTWFTRISPRKLTAEFYRAF